MAGKLSISKAWDETRVILARDGKLFATVAAALLILPGVLRDLATPVAKAGEMPRPGLWILVWLVTLLIGAVGQVALVRLALANRTTVGEAIGHAGRRSPVYIGGQILWTLPFAIGLTLLMPGIQQKSGPMSALFLIGFGLFIFIAVRMALTTAAVSEERVGVVGLLTRSWELTAGNWWRLFGFCALLLIGAGVLSLAAMAVVGLIIKSTWGAVEPMSVGALLISLANQIVTASAYVVLMAMLGRLYAQATGRSASSPISGT